MNFPKGIFQKLSVLKSSSALLLPIILALIAVILFIPTQLMNSRLKKRMENESISKMGRQIKSLSTNAVSRDQWTRQKENQHVYANDANQIELLSMQSTQRELLSYDIFPEPKGTSILIFKGFGQAYCAAVDQLIARADARDCPTVEELNRELESSTLKLQTGRSRSYYGEGDFSGRSQGMSGLNLGEVENKIVDEICRERAKSISFYANPANLSGYRYWKEYQYNVEIKKVVEDCWYYQLAYWVIEDVFDTINACNAGSNGAQTSPVKRLLSVNFNMGRGRDKSYGSQYGERGSSADTTTPDSRPVYILSPEKALIESCTGRTCNDNIDVIHFDVIVIIRAKSVLPFMQELCSVKEHQFSGFSGDKEQLASLSRSGQNFKHNQITILECKMRSIDRADPEHNYYRYGEDAVVELDLFCEYIFNKKGYAEIMPEAVKESMKTLAAPNGGSDSAEQTGRY